MPETSQAAFPATVASVPAARRWVRGRLPSWLSHEDCERIVLLVSETVTNAFIHGRSEARLRIQVRPDAVRIEVGDDNSRHPQRIERQDDALDGRGLDILDLLASRWGVDDDVAGKVVWFELPLPG